MQYYNSTLNNCTVLAVFERCRVKTSQQTWSSDSRSKCSNKKGNYVSVFNVDFKANEKKYDRKRNLKVNPLISTQSQLKYYIT